jgi:hypothetical protein
MDNHTLIEHIRKSVPSLISLYGFGSQAKGIALRAATSRARTDPASNMRRLNSPSELVVQLHCDIDLVDLPTASAVIQVLAVLARNASSARVLGYKESSKTWTTHPYARLNEERREILNDVRRQGSVCRVT